MAGVGGIFPSHEDHELDKKKISEHFADNFHEILYPLNYTSKHGPYQFHCPKDFKNFIDLNSITWNGKIKVQQKDDPSAAVVTNTEILCSTVNNFIHSCVSKINYQINDFQMGDSGAKSYSYKAYFDNLLSFSTAAKKQSLRYHGFAADTAGKFNEVQKAKANHPNKGFVERSKLFCNGNYFHFSVKLRIDLANVDQYLQPGVQLRFEIERNDDSFALLSDVGNDTTFEIDIKDSSIQFDKMVPTDQYLKHFEESISKKKLIYSYDKTAVYNHLYPANINDLSIYSLFHTDKLPSYFVLGMVSNSAYNGGVDHNPFSFQNFDIKEFYFLVNGAPVPTQPIKMDVASKDYHHVFVDEFLDKLQIKNSNSDIGISSEDWIDGNFLWIVDLNTDKCSNFHEHQSTPGTIHLKMETKSPLTETVTLVIYTSSRERFSIDPKTGEVLSTITL